uniref:Cleavage and polyadenylation specific factor 7 n=1 Tax=Callithrix jacchus TaxID=9483 RepID=A0A8I3XFC7_CALJA
MGSDPRRPGRAGGGARPGAGRSGWGRAGAAGMLCLWRWEVSNHCPSPNPGPSSQPRTLLPAQDPHAFSFLRFSESRSGIFLTLSILRARDLPSGAMSEGVDLIDIYADEEFNQDPEFNNTDQIDLYDDVLTATSQPSDDRSSSTEPPPPVRQEPSPKPNNKTPAILYTYSGLRNRRAAVYVGSFSWGHLWDEISE